MKTMADLERLAPRSLRTPEAGRTIRLGLAVSAIAVLTAIVLNGILEIPAIAIVMAVIVIGFAVSWRAAGSSIDDDA